MSSVSERKKFITHKLNFLTEQKARFDNYVDKIVAAGNSWTDTTENRNEFVDLCLQIDKAVDCICLKCEEISGTAAVLQQDASQPSLTTFTTTAVSHIQISATARATDDSMLRKVLERIEVMEEAFNSVRRNTEKFGDKQLEHENQIKEILSKTSKIDKKQNLKFNEVTERMKNLTENQTEIRKEQKLGYQSLEKQLSDIQRELRGETSSYLQQLESQIADVTCEVETAKDKINELNFVIESFMNESSGRIKSVEKLAGEVSEKVMADGESLGTLSEMVTSNTETLGTLTEKVTSNTETLGTLSEKVTSNTDTLETLCQTQEQNKSSLKEFEAKLVETGAASEAEVSKIRLQVVDIDTKLREVMSVSTEVAPRLEMLETQSSRQQIGFTADIVPLGRADEGTPISHYHATHTNVGGHFNATTGLFTVPIDGLYVVSLFLRIHGNGMFTVYIKRRPGGSDPKGDVNVCSVVTKVKLSNVGNLCVCELKAGDVLFLSPGYSSINCRQYLIFSCFRLGQ